MDRAGHAQGKEWTEQSRVGLSSAGLGLWLNEATANWSAVMGRRHDKDTHPSRAGSNGEGRCERVGGRRAAQRQAKSKAGRQRPVIVFISRAAPALFALFYGFLSLLLRLIVVSCVVSDSLCVCLQTYVCVSACVLDCVLSPGADKSMSVFPIHCLFSLSAQRRINYSIV